MGDFKESFNLNAGTFDLSPEEWPNDLASNFSSVMQEFVTQASNICMRILTALSLAMDLKVRTTLPAHAAILKRNKIRGKTHFLTVIQFSQGGAKQ